MTVLLTLEVMEVSSQKMVRAMTVRVGAYTCVRSQASIYAHNISILYL